MNTKSLYDPSRDTVGKIYSDAQKGNQENVSVGDMANEMMKGLVEDINEAISIKPFGDKPWYIMIHEKKDLQMKSAILRRVLHFDKRPWPEDDTTVFWHDPIKIETRFCWALPHHTEMFTILGASDLFSKDLIAQIKAWQNFDLWHFGFMKDEIGNWIANPKWVDKSLS